jgi:hypothetical protein
MANTFVYGDSFLGFGKESHCEKCNNDFIEVVIMSSMAQGVMYIPYSTDRMYVGIICPICHDSKALYSSMFVKKKDIDTKDPDYKTIYESLLAGKQNTLNEFKKMGWIRKRRYLSHLTFYKFDELVDFLQS